MSQAIIMKNNIRFFVDYQLSPHDENNVTNKNNKDQILAVLRNIKKDVSEYDDNRSESDANESGSESDASYRFELNYGDNADVDKYHFCIRFVRVHS